MTEQGQILSAETIELNETMIVIMSKSYLLFFIPESVGFTVFLFLLQQTNVYQLLCAGWPVSMP